jgi:hypothetical protein
MTLLTYYRRFLKENGLYSEYVKHNRKHFYASIINELDCTRYIHSHQTLSDMILSTCGYYKCFNYDSNHPARRKLYRISQKWRKRVNNSFIQHNVEVGDRIKIHGRLFWKSNLDEEYIVYKFSDDGRYVYVKKNEDEAATYTIPLLKIKSILGKDLVNNIYYIENKANYGKINDSIFHEVQL